MRDFLQGVLWFPPFSNNKNLVIQASHIENSLFDDLNASTASFPIQGSIPAFEVFTTCFLHNSMFPILFLKYIYPMHQNQNPSNITFPISLLASMIFIFETDDSAAALQSTYFKNIYTITQQMDLPLCVLFFGNYETAIPEYLHLADKIFHVHARDLSQALVDYFLNLWGLDTFTEKLSSLSPQKIPYPILPSAFIDKNCIGLGDGIPELLVSNLIEILIEHKRHFKIWVDRGSNVPNEILSGKQVIYIINDPEYGISFRDNYIASPQIKHLQNAKFQLYPAYYLYVEFNNYIYDSFMAFGNNISVNDYQNDLRSTDRYVLDVDGSKVEIAEAKLSLINLINKVRIG